MIFKNISIYITLVTVNFLTTLFACAQSETITTADGKTMQGAELTSEIKKIIESENIAQFRTNIEV
ncbi:hypothetical protein [Mariniflexile sp. HMF6888]|uniref:hypothetical protein n=1 Tax=Mariniflexile sp. HMF6888 TaxID=3373086 RepID=UPI00379CF19B